MDVIILCGGRGVRAFPFTECIPKPMLPVNGSPIVMQLIRSFVTQGYRNFVLAAGYRKSVLDDYFDAKSFGASVTILDTGADADTGERVFACRNHVRGRFLATYGDGLSDVSLEQLVAFHRSHGRLATVTAVPLSTQYGVLESDRAGRVTAMREKPVLWGHWINIGFMVFEPEVFEHWRGTNLEREVLPALAAVGELFVYQHVGFFKSMDSYKDQQEFEELSKAARLPWNVDVGAERRCMAL
jgi:glucose-1-phosphate cytidylyltransferase